MITGIVLVLLMWITKNDLEFMTMWILCIACAIESVMIVNMIAKIFGAW